MRISFLFLLLILSTVQSIFAQAVAPNNAPVWNSFSLQGWEENQRIALFDRRGFTNGYITDRGIFQRFTPGMTDEYDLNSFGYAFTPQNDHLWYRNDNGFRMFAGRQTDLKVSVFSQFKIEAEVTKRSSVGVRFTKEEDARSQRGFAVLSYNYKFDKNNTLSAFHTVSEEEQDMDAGLSYRFGHPQSGYVRVELAALDYLNNLKVESINEILTGQDTVRHYRRSPFFGNFAFSSPTLNHFRVEGFAGLQTESQAEVAPSKRRTQRFLISERAHYQGIMVEWVKNSLSTAVTYTREMSAAEIDTLVPSNIFSRYNSKQVQQNIAAHVMITSNDYVWESSIVNVLQSDVQQGTDFLASPSYSDSLNFRATRFMTRNRVMRRPFFKGLIAGMEHIGDFRAPNDDAVRLRTWSNSIHDVNHRISLLLGWQFNPRAWFTYGYSLDLDADYHLSPDGDGYDGGFIRLELRW